jgi:hypothetical protein
LNQQKTQEKTVLKEQLFQYQNQVAKLERKVVDGARK